MIAPTRKKLIVIFVLSVFAAITGIIMVGLASEPRHSGKTLLQILTMTASSSGERRARGISDEQVREALEEARAMGPGIDGFLIRTLQVQDTSWRSNYQSFYRSSLARPFRRYLSPPESAIALRQLAARVIGKLGRMSPKIERALIVACRDPDPIVRMNAVMILGYKGSRSQEVIAAMELAMKDKLVATCVGEGPNSKWFQFDFQPKNIQEAIQDLDRPWPTARYEAAYALRALGTNAAPAIPDLLRILNDEGPVRIACIRALGAIGPAASNALPALRKLRAQEDSSLARATMDEVIGQIESPTKR